MISISPLLSRVEHLKGLILDREQPRMVVCASSNQQWNVNCQCYENERKVKTELFSYSATWIKEIFDISRDLADLRRNATTKGIQLVILPSVVSSADLWANDDILTQKYEDDL